MYGHRTDLVFLEVHDAFWFEEEIQEDLVRITGRIARGTGSLAVKTSREIFDLSPDQVRHLLKLQFSCAGVSSGSGHFGTRHHNRTGVQQALKDFGVDAVPHLAIRMQQPLAMLVARGEFRTVAFPASSTLARFGCKNLRVPDSAGELLSQSGVPLEIRRQPLAAGRRENFDDFNLQSLPGELSFAADKLCEWYSSIMVSHLHDREVLEHVIRHLNTAATCLQHGPNPARRFGRIPRSLDTVVKILRVTDDIRSDLDLQAVLSNCLELIANDTMAKAFLTDAAECMGKCPSKGTLSKYRQVADSAYMVWNQQRAVGFVNNHVLYFLSDSSPQANRNWVLTEVRLLRKDTAREVYLAMSELYRTKGNSSDSSEVSDAFQAVDRAELFKVLQKGCSRHMFPPAAVGARRESLVHKLHAVLHSMRLDLGTWQLVMAAMAATCTITTDAGHESGFAAGDHPKLDQFFPHIRDDSWKSDSLHSLISLNPGSFDSFESKEADTAGPAGAEAGSAKAFEKSLWVQGGHHVCDGATDKITSEMKQAEWFKSLLQAVREYFKTTGNRELFVNQCLTSEQAKRSYAWLFDKKPPTMLEIRWGSLLAVARWVLDRRQCLQRHWSETKMKQVDKKAVEKPEALQAVDGETDSTKEKEKSRSEDRERLDRTCTAISSSFFWCFAYLIALLGDVLDAMDGFFDSCMCHSYTDYLLEGVIRKTTYWFRQKALQGDTGQRVKGKNTICPMRGCIAPLLAAGKLSEFIRRLLDIAYSRLLWVKDWLGGDVEPQWKLLVADFNAAKAHLVLWFSMKLGCWTSLPYLTAGLGHPDMTVARTVISKAVLLYDANRDDASRHPITVELFGPGQLRTELDQFLGGIPLRELPNLVLFAVKMMCIPLNERSIEARHRDVALSVRAAPNNSTTWVSWNLRSPEIWEHLKESPGFLQEFADAACEVREVLRAAIRLGLSDYPIILEEMELKGRIYPKVFGLVLYHCDVSTIYKSQPLRAKRKAAKQTGAVRKKLKTSQQIAKGRGKLAGKGRQTGLQPVEKRSGKCGAKPDSQHGGGADEADGQQVGEGTGKAGLQPVEAVASSDSHMLDLLPRSATRHFQQVFDKDSWYSVSRELIAAGGLEDLDARLIPTVGQMSGASAATIMPEILDGLTEEQQSELLLLQVDAPSAAASNDGFAEFDTDSLCGVGAALPTVTRHATIEVDGIEHTMIRIVKWHWQGVSGMRCVDNDVVGVDSLDIIVTTHDAYQVGADVVVDEQAQRRGAAGSVKVLSIPRLDFATMRRSILKWKVRSSAVCHFCGSVLGAIPVEKPDMRREMLCLMDQFVKAHEFSQYVYKQNTCINT